MGGDRERGGVRERARERKSCIRSNIYMQVSEVTSDSDADEACLYGKRDLFVWQKRPICMAKETYLYGKRDLFG